MDKRRRPRALTLTLPNSKQPFLMLGEKKYTLRNFSQEGIGLWVPPPVPFGLALGSHISGDVVIGSEIFPVTLEIMHHAPGIVGLRIVSRSQELSEIFRNLMQPAIHAAQLMAHPESGAEDRIVGHSRLWYQSEGASELLIWYNNYQRMILSLQLCWLGKWIFRRQFQSSQTGFLSEESPSGRGKIKEPRDLMMIHPEPDTELLHQAAQFLTAVPTPLPGHLLWQFLETGEQIYLPEAAVSRVESKKKASGGNGQ